MKYYIKFIKCSVDYLFDKVKEFAMKMPVTTNSIDGIILSPLKSFDYSSDKINSPSYNDQDHNNNSYKPWKHFYPQIDGKIRRHTNIYRKRKTTSKNKSRKI